MKKNINLKKFEILKGEKFLYFLLVLLAILLPISNVFIKALLSESNIQVEQLKKEITVQTNLNESLNMQVNELASLDKIQEVAKVIGLSYNNDNVRVINASR